MRKMTENAVIKKEDNTTKIFLDGNEIRNEELLRAIKFLIYFIAVEARSGNSIFALKAALEETNGYMKEELLSLLEISEKSF